jgi:uncharacterized Zn finger protein (UPF0148 family)
MRRDSRPKAIGCEGFELDGGLIRRIDGAERIRIMPEIVLPCPRCQMPLLVDDGNAGAEVLCPGCKVHLILPADPGGKVPVREKSAIEAETTGDGRRNFRLSRTGHAGAVEGAEVVVSDPERRVASLPQKRRMEDEEEQKRLAAMVGEAGAGVAEREKAVLPERRQVVDVPSGEQTGAGRPKRQGGEFPPVRKSGEDVSGGSKERVGVPPGAAEPIPARGDAEFAVKLPPRREPVPEPPVRASTESPVSSERESAAVSAAVPAEPAPPKPRVPRVAPERAPAFSPKHEADLSVENVGEWGGGGEPAEQSPAFRRTVSLALVFLLLAGGGAAVVASRGFFAKAPAAGAAAEADGGATRNKEAATAVLRRFFGADTVDAMAKEVRHPELTGDRMRRYYASQALTPRQVSFETDWEEVGNFEGKGVDFIYTTVEVDSFQKRQVWLELPKDGSDPKLDWEHAVSWSEVPWSDFLTGNHEQPVAFRVTASPVHHYIGAFEDEYRYHAFRLADPEDSLNCYGYCETDSEIARQLLAECQQARRRGEVNSEGEGVARCMLRLRPVAEGKRFNQYIIDGFAWKTWVEP